MLHGIILVLTFALSLLLAGPAAAGWTVAYMPTTNLERLGAAWLDTYPKERHDHCAYKCSII